MAIITNKQIKYINSLVKMISKYDRHRTRVEYRFNVMSSYDGLKIIRALIKKHSKLKHEAMLKEHENNRKKSKKKNKIKHIAQIKTYNPKCIVRKGMRSKNKFECLV